MLVANDGLQDTGGGAEVRTGHAQLQRRLSDPGKPRQRHYVLLLHSRLQHGGRERDVGSDQLHDAHRRILKHAR